MYTNTKFVFAILIASLGFMVHFLFFKVNISPEVQIAQGRVRGSTHESRIGKEYYKYLGIPYAQAPVGSLRFEVSRDYKIDSGK
jgi:hypothetical protein